MSRHRRNPYRAPEPPAPPPRLNYPYPHKSGAQWGDHPPHSGTCADHDGWASPWELRSPQYDILEPQ